MTEIFFSTTTVIINADTDATTTKTISVDATTNPSDNKKLKDNNDNRNQIAQL